LDCIFLARGLKPRVLVLKTTEGSA